MRWMNRLHGEPPTPHVTLIGVREKCVEPLPL
jgi:hypothetical protein